MMTPPAYRRTSRRLIHRSSHSGAVVSGGVLGAKVCLRSSLEYDLASVVPSFHVTVGLGGLGQREGPVHVDLQPAAGRQASKFLEVCSGIVAQALDQISDLEAVNRGVLGVEVAGIDGARLQRDV